MQRNAYFQLSTRDDGLYIILYPPAAGGTKLTLSEIQQYLKRLHIKPSDINELTIALDNLNFETEVKLSDEAAARVNESVVIASVSSDRMSASARFYAASEDGGKLDRTEIIYSLNQSGIIHGIIEAEIDDWLENRVYCTSIVIAQGTPPEESVDAVIDYKFETTPAFRPTVEVDGSVNFRQLNLFNDVSMGDVLAVLTPAYHGQPGSNVLGVTLPSKAPAKKMLKYGKNVQISEDSLVLTAEVSGHVYLDNERVLVENVYSIKGNVGTATGDVDFDGIVTISGDVLTGYTVKASGDIIIEGVVEGANIIAGGNIVIASGVHGGAKASISAGGDLTVKFVQESVVTAGGNIYAGSILYSKVMARGSIEVVSGKGLIKGGELSARVQIAARTVGSPLTGSNAQLEVGASTYETERFRALEEELAGKRAEQTKVRQAMSFLTRKIEQGATLTPDQDKLLRALPHQQSLLDDTITKMFQMYLALKEDMLSSESGKIIVEGTVFEGAKIIISGVAFYVREDIVQCQFVKRGMEIKIYSID